MPKIYEIYNAAISKGKPFGVLSADLRVLIAHDEGFNLPIDTLLHKDDEMRHVDLFERQFADLIKEKPVEYIVNEATFLERKLFVDERVLIPRMETEELVANITEKIDDYFDPRNYLVCADIGTGSGAIAIALKSLFPNWIVLASDISPKALEVARINIASNALSVTTYLGSSLTPFISNNIFLDIIVCNPPYVTKEEETQDSVKKYEPSSALWLNPNDSVYEEIFKNYKQVKKGSLLMCFEIGYDLVPFLTDLMNKYLSDFQYKFVDDLNGRPRFLFIFLK